MKKIRWKRENKDFYTFQKYIPILGTVVGYIEKDEDSTYSLEIDQMESGPEIDFPDEYIEIESLEKAKRLAEEEVKKALKKIITRANKYLRAK